MDEERGKRLVALGEKVAKQLHIGAVDMSPKWTRKTCGNDLIAGLALTRVLASYTEDILLTIAHQENPEFTWQEIQAAAGPFIAKYMKESTERFKAKFGL